MPRMSYTILAITCLAYIFVPTECFQCNVFSNDQILSQQDCSTNPLYDNTCAVVVSQGSPKTGTCVMKAQTAGCNVNAGTVVTCCCTTDKCNDMDFYNGCTSNSYKSGGTHLRIGNYFMMTTAVIAIFFKFILI